MPTTLRIFTVLASLAVLLLAGCEADTDCLDATRKGDELGRIGMPAEADRHEIPAKCRPAFEAVWNASIESYCQPEHGFEIGYSDSIYYGVCRGETFNQNYRLGRTLWVMEVERDALKQQLASLDAGREPAYPDEAAQIRSRVRVLERDIPELKTLARIQGLLED